MRKAAILISTLLLVGGCRPQPARSDIEGQLQSLVDATVSDYEMVHGAALHVDAPSIGLRWEGAAGLADPENGRPMTPATPVRIASNTKTFVAAAVLRLVEEGRLDLDDPIRDRLPTSFVNALESDGYDPSAITLRHLLTHTSGLFDHSSGERYTEAILADPAHHWTPAEQLEKAIDWGEPLGAPGEYFAYCDTGYVLLGVVIQEASGQPLAQAVRGLIGYDTLGLDSTWWEVLEAEPAGIPERAHQFYGDIDTFAFAPYFDLYGGGGIVSTVGDLARFYRALFTGEVYTDPSTLATMLTSVEGAEPLPDGGPAGYRMGIWRVEVGDYETWRHSGFFGTIATYVPGLGLTVAATVNQNQGKLAMDRLVRDAIWRVAESGIQPTH